MKCSIIIPNYNQGHLLQRSVYSVINQTIGKENLEIVIVDDGSKDNSLLVAQNIISSNKSHNIKLIKKQNGGTASARNAGILNSSGQYIGFLDADDEYHTQKAEISIKYLEIAEEVGLVYSDYFEIKGDKVSYTSQVDFEMSKLRESCIVSTNSFIKRSVVEKVGLFNESIKIIEDYEYWLRICSSGFVAMRIPAPLFKYYLHGENKTIVSDQREIFNEHVAVLGAYKK